MSECIGSSQKGIVAAVSITWVRFFPKGKVWYEILLRMASVSDVAFDVELLDSIERLEPLCQSQRFPT